MIGGLLHYIAWAVTLVCCSGSFHKSTTGDGAISSTNRVNVNNSGPSLFFPLDVYAWSVGQSLATLGIMGSLSEILTHEAWKSFEKRENKNNNNKNSIVEGFEILPPTEIAVLNVQDFLESNDDGYSALAYLRKTYGSRWNQRPLLLRGLWTKDELLNLKASSTPTNHQFNRSGKKRQLNPEGLLNMTDLEIPYFSDATQHGALEPDATGTVSEIVQNMIEAQKPHKIGSQFVVQDNPALMEEVAPLRFLTSVLGNHFSQDHLMGNPNRKGILSHFLPGTTTVPLFVANTRALRKDGPSTIDKDYFPQGNCPVPNGDTTVDTEHSTTGSDYCSNPQFSNTTVPTSSTDTATAAETKIPFTGLHCEPIANVAVQLWGSRTWTLVDPEHSWKLRPSISKDGRSFYPSWISSRELETTIPRYVATTTPGDALWLPTWTYHKVDYVYQNDKNPQNGNEYYNGDAHSQKQKQQQQQRLQLQRLHEHHLSIGASLFHFRPIDYVRRNPLFALLLIPSLIRELAGIKTQ